MNKFVYVFEDEDYMRAYSTLKLAKKHVENMIVEYSFEWLSDDFSGKYKYGWCIITRIKVDEQF